MILFTLLSHELMSKNWRRFVFIILLINGSWALLKSRDAGISDIDLSYVSQVKVHRQMVQFMEQERLQDSIIATHFLMIEQLTHPSCGYLSSAPFKRVGSSLPEASGYLVISPIEQDFDLNKIAIQYDTLCLKHFNRGPAWCKLYKLKAKSSAI
jgi:hypothetical protein